MSRAAVGTGTKRARVFLHAAVLGRHHRALKGYDRREDVCATTYSQGVKFYNGTARWRHRRMPPFRGGPEMLQPTRNAIAAPFDCPIAYTRFASML